jgi:methylmalonyl-CoA/ethylmalonyl-CoA epimerase
MDDILQSYVKKLDHVAIAVRRIRDALPLYRDALAGEYHQGGYEEAGGFRWVQLTYPGGGKLELLEPATDNSFLHEFLEKRGEGVHHITFMVRDIEALVEHLKAKGYHIVGENYRHPEWKEAFISPRSAHGTVVQLAESTLDEAGQVQAWKPDLEALLQGEV